MTKLKLNWHYNEKNPKQMILNYRLCDFYLAQLKLQGFYVLGSLFWEYTPKWKET